MTTASPSNEVLAGRVAEWLGRSARPVSFNEYPRRTGGRQIRASLFNSRQSAMITFTELETRDFRVTIYGIGSAEDSFYLSRFELAAAVERVRACPLFVMEADD